MPSVLHTKRTCQSFPHLIFFVAFETVNKHSRKLCPRFESAVSLVFGFSLTSLAALGRTLCGMSGYFPGHHSLVTKLQGGKTQVFT